MSVSVALKRPERNFGGIIDSRASSFTDGSARVYISVVCLCACPSHRETFRKSLVAYSTVRAQVCLNRCGNTRLVASEGHLRLAVRMCLRKMYSMPERVKDAPRALTKRSGTRAIPRRVAESEARRRDINVDEWHIYYKLVCRSAWQPLTI
jgi:hypothetical protein